MEKIVRYFIEHHRVTNMVIILLFLTGFFSLLNLRTEQFPSISFDIMQVQTVYPGASPEDVELHVTEKIEDRLLEVENIKRMTSMSLENVSIINIEIDGESGDPEKIKQDINDAVSRVTDLPEEISERPVVEEVKMSNLPVLEVAVTGDASELELRKYARAMEDVFKEVPGVSLVEKIGYRKRELKIEASAEEIKKYRISIFEIMNAVSARNVRQSGGTLESYVSEKNVVTLSEFSDLKEVNDVIVRSNYEGYNVKVTDLARVTDGFEDADVLYHTNGQPAIGLIVIAQENADIVDVAGELNRKIENMRKALPDDVTLDLVTDYSIMTRMMLKMVVSNGIMGFFLVLLVLMIFLDLKSAFWCAYGIPFSIIASFAFFRIFNLSVNVITLMAMILMLGILVDDAIVITEKIFLNRQGGMDGESGGIDAVKKMFKPVFASVSTTMLAFLPVIFVKGVMGRLAKDIPVVVITVLSISFVDAVIFLPVHLKNMNVVKSSISKRHLLIDKVSSFYRKVIEKCIKRKYLVLGVYFLILVFLFGFSAKFLRFILDEDIDPDYFNVIIETPDGTPLRKTSDMLKPVEDFVISTLPSDQVEGVTTQVGHHSDDVFGSTSGYYSNWAIISVFLRPAAERTVTSEEMMGSLKPGIEKLRVENNFQRLNLSVVAGFPVGRPVDITFVSGNDALREKYEKKLVSFLQGINGVEKIETTNLKGKDELVLKLDYRKLAQVGLTSLDVAQSVRAAFEGTVVTSVKNNGEDVDFRVRLDDRERFREENIMNIPVTNAAGQLIELQHFARLVPADGKSSIRHYNGKRSVNVSADINVKVTTSAQVNSMIKKEFFDEIDRNPEIRMITGGQQEESELSIRSFMMAAIVVVISIYFILVMVFDSYFQPLIIMSIIPFAVGATFMTLIIHGRPLIMISLLGMLGLLGVVVNDTIVMIDHLNENCRKKGNDNNVIALAASERFRPVMLTTLTTFGGLIPAAYGFGGDIPSIRPMVLVMAWGLVFCTTITLGFIPVLYSVVSREKHPGKKESRMKKNIRRVLTDR